MRKGGTIGRFSTGRRAPPAALALAAGLLLVTGGAAHAFEPSSGISVIEGPNVRITVVDPAGNRTGWDAGAGVEVREIPESNYLDERTGPVDLPIFVAYVENPRKGVYRVLAAGTGSGDFFVEVGLTTRTGGWRTTRYDGTTAPGRQYLYEIRFDPDDPGQNSVSAVTWDVHWKGRFEGTEPVPVRRGRKLNLCLEVKQHDGKPAAGLRVRLALRRESEEDGSAEDVQAQGSALFKWVPEKHLYRCTVKTGDLDPGLWQVRARFEDGSVFTRRIEVR